MDLDLIQALCVSCQAERDQALFYRALAMKAEKRGLTILSRRLNDLHADEQLHEARIAARVLELGAQLADFPASPAYPVPLDQWEPHARRRERDELKRYELLLAHDLDESTAALIREIVDTERHHERELGGEWIPA